MTDEMPPPSEPTSAMPPARREPAFNLPGVVLGCCVVLLGIHAVRAFVGVETDNTIVAWLALMPARLTLALHVQPARLTEAYHAAVDHNPIMAAQIDFLIGDGHARWWTLLTYALLHGSWTHVGFNCVWLVAFGSAVARRFSSLRFLLLMVVSALAGALVQYAADVTSFQLVLGASASVSGAMGAATRFVFRPTGEQSRLFDRAAMNEAFRQPALSLRQVVTTKVALVFVLFWFATNLLFGYVPALSGIGEGPVAWQAHIGGFLAGLLLFALFDPKRPPLVDTEDSADIAREDVSAAGVPAGDPVVGPDER